MSKTWSITTEHTVVTRYVVHGNTEEEALENYYADDFIDEEEVDAYDWEVTGVEEDIPE